MSDCCSIPSDCAGAHASRARCPVNGVECHEVSLRTVLHQIQAPWTWTPTARHYYFCGSPDCEVAYFGDDHSTVLKSQLRKLVGIKASGALGLLCYCFGLSQADFERNPDTRAFVIAQTKNGVCSCETCNPSGRCCLKDFPKASR